MTGSVPRILVIDDTLALSAAERSRFCSALHLKDAGVVDVAAAYWTSGEPDCVGKVPDGFVAEAFFHPGQAISENGAATNSVPATMAAVKVGWPRKADRRYWALVLLDQTFQPGPKSGDSRVGTPDVRHGAAILDGIAAAYPFRKRYDDEPSDFMLDIPVVTFTTEDRKTLEDDLDKRGSLAFFQKPRDYVWSPTHYGNLVDLLFQYGLVEDGALPLRSLDKDNKVQFYHRDGDLVVGRSLAMLRALRTARRYVRVAPAAVGSQGTQIAKERRFVRPIAICLRGEAGVGKELVARYLHNLRQGRSERVGRPQEFVAVDFNAGSGTLFEGALFGAFPGAFTDCPKGGVESAFSRAKHGTLFLDEIGNLDKDLLPKLLRPIGEGRYRKLGTPSADDEDVSEEERSELGIPIYCQIVCATNKPLEQCVHAKSFPPDLYQRFAGQVFIPSLNAREDDVALITTRLIESIARSEAKAADHENPSEADLKPYMKEMSKESWTFVRTGQWRGNVRALKRAIELAAGDRKHSTMIQEHDVKRFCDDLLERELEYVYRPTVKFAELLQLVAKADMTGTEESELRSAIPKLKNALGKLVLGLVDAAAAHKKHADGSPNKAAVASLLFGEPLSGGAPATKFKQLVALGVARTELSKFLEVERAGPGGGIDGAEETSQQDQE